MDNFKEALVTLGIEDYGQRIFNSNSHGELFHLADYLKLAELYKKDSSTFREWFEAVVRDAEINWSRPESVFQHIYTIYLQSGFLIKTKKIKA